MEAITKMEGVTGKKFGDKENPLLVSVRSGARASMPGMMDTILNLGLNEDVVNVLAEKSGNARCIFIAGSFRWGLPASPEPVRHGHSVALTAFSCA